MTVHVGELATQVEVQGVAGPTAAATTRPTVWDERQHHRDLADELAALRARTRGAGFGDHGARAWGGHGCCDG
jgi:hypothetical protein